MYLKGGEDSVKELLKHILYSFVLVVLSLIELRLLLALFITLLKLVICLGIVLIPIALIVYIVKTKW